MMAFNVTPMKVKVLNWKVELKLLYKSLEWIQVSMMEAFVSFLLLQENMILPFFVVAWIIQMSWMLYIFSL